MMELFLLSCTGVVVFLHGANFFFHALSHHFAFRSLRYQKKANVVERGGKIRWLHQGRPGKQVQLSEVEIKQLCVASRDIFISSTTCSGRAPIYVKQCFNVSRLEMLSKRGPASQDTKSLGIDTHSLIAMTFLWEGKTGGQQAHRFLQDCCFS